MKLAIVIIPLVPIFLLSRLLIWASREFLGAVAAILVGNGVALLLMIVLGAVALSTTGAPDWERSLALFSIYGIVALFDLVRLVLLRLQDDNDAALLPPLPGRPTQVARDRTKLRP